MKKKIIIFLAVASLIFILAGVYIIASIEKTTSDLDNLIMLHQVEIMREHLLIRVQKVQSDLNLMGTRHARSYDTIVSDVTNMGDAVEICFDCHHTREVAERLTDLRRHIRHYKNGLSRVLTIKADVSRLQAEEDVAFKTGEELVTKINTMIALTNRKLMEETESSLGKIGKTKTILFFLVTVAPIILGGFAFVFIRGFTKPVSMLLAATRKLKGGDLEYRVSALKDEFGEVAESFNEMAGALKEQMYKIEESEKRYRALFERAGDAIFIIDTESENRFRIVAANQAAAEMHGYTEEELLTMKITDIGTPDAAEGAPLLFDNILKGSWVNVEVMHRKKDGVVFPVEISAGLLELGNHNYILAFERDITERKKAEDLLQRTEQLRVAGDLAAGLTHELKNSLAGIKISIEVLLDELSLSEEDRNVLKGMIREVRRIELLMKDILSFARPSRPHFSYVNINAILDTSMTFSLKNVSDDGLRPITVVKDFDELMPKTMVDPMQLQQVFMNLLINAVESMPNGGSITVRTHYEAPEDFILISISDTGKGIDKELINRIFEPFFTTKPKGTGLGLPITKRLIEQHGGVMSIENNSRGGATFKIILPVKHAEEVNVT